MEYHLQHIFVAIEKPSVDNIIKILFPTNPLMSEYNQNWTALVRNIHNGRTILVLGPAAITMMRNGQRISLQNLLRDHLAEELHRRDPQLTLLPDPSLAYIAEKLEDTIFVQERQKRASFSDENARTELYNLIAGFYDQYAFTDFPVYRQLAKMPFHFIIETDHAPYLEYAFNDENKLDTKRFYYHYANPTHNNSIQFKDEEIRADAPLIYQLFGSAEQPDSMIVTERDQLAFLDAILQQENTAGIPNKVAIHFTSVKGKNTAQQFDKTFIFLGFDFNEWHLRLIMHLIGRYQRQKETYALQNPGDIGALTRFFYSNNFDVRFVDTPAEQFLSEIQAALAQPETVTAPTSGKLKVFLMYAPEDEAVKTALDVQLNPIRRTEFIETWDESQLLPGTDTEQEIAQRIEAADIILPLITDSFFGSDRIYECQLQLALRRHEAKEATVIPLLMRSCPWEGTLPDELKATTLPRNLTAMDKQDNPDTALADTVKQLSGWCKKIYNRKKLAK